MFNRHIVDGMENVGSHITDEDLAVDQLLAEVGNEIAPVVHSGLTPRQAYAFMLKDKGVRGKQLKNQMDIFDKAKNIKPEAK